MAMKSRKSSRKGASLADADREYAASSGQQENALYDTLERLGLNERVEALRSKLDEMDVRRSVKEAQDYLSEQIDSARDYARENPGKVIGGAAGVLVGASLLAYALSRGGSKKKSGSRKKASSSKKKSSSKKRR